MAVLDILVPVDVLGHSTGLREGEGPQNKAGHEVLMFRHQPFVLGPWTAYIVLRTMVKKVWPSGKLLMTPLSRMKRRELCALTMNLGQWLALANASVNAAGPFDQQSSAMV